VFDSLPSSVRDVSAAITFLLPGFLAVSLFEVTNPSLARDRLPLQWTMWSLATSLLLYSAAYGLYSWFDWPRAPLDYEFFVPRILGSIAIGWTLGWLAGSERGRGLTRRLKLFIRAWVWVEVMSEAVTVSVGGRTRKEARWVVIHLKDGTRLYGYPRRYTDDRREEVRELYITEPHRYDAEEGRFLPIPDSAGLLVSTSEIFLTSPRC
jgi:hypothetical protein